MPGHVGSVDWPVDDEDGSAGGGLSSSPRFRTASRMAAAAAMSTSTHSATTRHRHRSLHRRLCRGPDGEPDGGPTVMAMAAASRIIFQQRRRSRAGESSLESFLFELPPQEERHMERQNNLEESRGTQPDRARAGLDRAPTPYRAPYSRPRAVSPSEPSRGLRCARRASLSGWVGLPSSLTVH